MLTLVVTADGADYELTLPQAEQLPARDWPLESINPGAPVVAWYIPVRGTKSGAPFGSFTADGNAWWR